MEKKKNKITRLIGPPPMPRNEERSPSTTPMIQEKTGLVTW